MLNINKNYKQSTGLVIGTIFNSLLGLVFYVLIARNLGPDNFGQFSLLLGVGLLLSEIVDWGFDSAIVRFGSQGNLPSVLGAAFVERVILLLAALLVCLIATAVTGTHFYFSVLVAFSLSILALFTQSLLSRQKYANYIAANVLGNSMRLLTAFLFIFNNSLSPQIALLIFSGANLFASIFAFFVVQRTLHAAPFDFSGIRKKFREILGFSNWMGASFVAASVSNRIDVPLVYYLAGSTAAGFYSSAQRLISVFPQMASAVESVFSPKFSANSDISKNFREYLYISSIISAGILVFLPISGTLISFVFGARYLSSIPVFQLFLIGLVPFFLTGPFSASVVYRFGKSNYHFIVSLTQIAVGVVSYLIFVPAFKENGGALAFLTINSVSLILFICLYFKLKTKYV